MNLLEGLKDMKSTLSHPIEDVQSTVWAQCKQVMRGDALSFTSLWHHEQLWKNSYSLKVDAESPQDLKKIQMLSVNGQIIYFHRSKFINYWHKHAGTYAYQIENGV